jgi:hypothetical protein
MTMARDKTLQKPDTVIGTVEPNEPRASADGAPAGEPAGAESVAPPVRTQDRDPADREAWKRERARQLGHHR